MYPYTFDINKYKIIIRAYKLALSQQMPYLQQIKTSKAVYIL